MEWPHHGNGAEPRTGGQDLGGIGFGGAAARIFPGSEPGLIMGSLQPISRVVKSLQGATAGGPSGVTRRLSPKRETVATFLTANGPLLRPYKG